jgi:hypothetical protein
LEREVTQSSDLLEGLLDLFHVNRDQSRRKEDRWELHDHLANQVVLLLKNLIQGQVLLNSQVLLLPLIWLAQGGSVGGRGSS